MTSARYHRARHGSAGASGRAGSGYPRDVDPLTTPRSVSIRFSHASLQVLAEDHEVDLLHIKGPAIDDSLGGATRSSMDADVLVRPVHVDRLIEVMHDHGWSTQYEFEDGSAFEHAATLVHPFLASVDVHRRFPGMDRDAAAAFERLWADRHSSDIAGLACPVPSLDAQRLILILHAARGGWLTHPDIQRSWGAATAGEREGVIRLAGDIGAGVALAAGTGRLDAFVGQPGYELWRVLSTGEPSSVRVWLARVKAEPTVAGALRAAVHLIVPNPRRMRTALGRRPTSMDMARAYVRRARWGSGELVRVVRESVGRSRGAP